MVVKEDGTKWACHQCLKGHRVSGCTHTDRPLLFVPKKGRPVSQCQHCRVERKKRSAHVKCDCGERSHGKDKCPHVDAAHGELEPLPEDHELEEPSCCCHHGGKCTCASLKKEPSGDSPCHTPGSSTSQPRCKPRLTSTQSDGHITVFTNGHHKPVHRNNHAAHESGMPYKIPRSHTDHGVLSAARRSVDSLASISTNAPALWEKARAPVETGKTTGHSSSQHHKPSAAPTFSAPTSCPIEKQSSMDPISEIPFPQFSGTSSNLYDRFSVPVPTYSSSTADISGQPTNSWSTTSPDMDINQYTGESWNYFDWSMLGGTDVTNQPALTNPSSGTISEIDELPPPEETSNFEGQAIFNGGAWTPAKDATNQSNFVPLVKPDHESNLGFGQQNRWSLPASFLGSSSDMPFAEPESMDASANYTVASSSWLGAAGTASASTYPCGIQTPSTIEDDVSQSVLPSGPSARSRPKAVYQKANTSPGEMDWQNLLEQYSVPDLAMVGNDVAFSQFGSVTNLDAFSASGNNTTEGTPDSGAAFGSSLEVENDIQAYQSNNSSRLPMDNDYFSNFDFDTGLSNTTPFNDWES